MRPTSHPSSVTIARCLLPSLVVLGLAAAPRASFAGFVDPGSWATDGTVESIARDGNIAFVGGTFRWIGPMTGGGVPVSKSTLARIAGHARVVGAVTVVAPDGSDGWYLGGVFSYVGGQARQNLAHLDHHLQVDGWNPGANGPILAIAVTANDVFVSGQFTTAGGASRPKLARLDRVTGAASSWTPGSSADVLALATDGTTLYVGGSFTTIAATPRVALAAFTIATDALSSWNPAPTSISATVTIRAIALANGYVYVGGNTQTIGGQTRIGAAALQPGSGLASGWNPHVSNGAPNVLLPVGDRVYLGGDFTNVGGVFRSAAAAVDTAGGALLPWAPSISGTGPPFGSPLNVWALGYLGGSIALGGNFIGNFARFDTTTGAALGGTPIVPTSVSALATQGSTLYVGGGFSCYGPSARTHLAAVDLTTGVPTSWAPFATGAQAEYPPHVSALAFDATRVFASVTFFSDFSANRSQVIAYSRANGGQLWLAEGGAPVYALAHEAGKVYAGGEFTHLNGGATRLAALDATNGALQAAWNPAPDGVVYALLPTTGGLVAGGTFTNIGGQARARLAQVGYADGLATGWSPGADATVFALASTGTTLLAGGDFANAGGQPRARVVAIDLGGNSALAWNPGANGTVRALATDGDDVYAGGTFSTFGGATAVRLGAVDLVTAAPTPWTAGVGGNSTVFALAIGGAHILAGGFFSAMDVEPARSIAWMKDLTALAVEPAPESASGLALSIHPQPAHGTGRARFTLSRASRVFVQVVDVSGRVALPSTSGEWRAAGTHEVEIETRDLAPGLYFVRVSAGPMRATARLVTLP